MTILLLLLSIGIIILLTVRMDIHPFLALLVAALFFGLGTGMSFEQILISLNDGFGGTLGKIGLVIIFGVIIGAFLEHSGAAYKLADVVLKIIGKKRLYEAMGMVGFVVSIPVFADSGFIVINPLNKSLTKEAGLSIAGTATVLMLGLMMSHVLVPPTPGPIAAAGILKADVGLVMLVGLAIGLVSMIVAIWYSKKFASKVHVDPNPDVTEAEIKEKIQNAPGAAKSFLPILVPIVLIIVKSILEFKLSEESLSAGWIQVILFIGTPVIALMIGMLIAFMLPKKLDKSVLSTTGWVGKAMSDSAGILLITGAGGVFGAVLKSSDLATSITDMMSGVDIGIFLPFLLCAAIKTAQGSSTVALITTASIMAPLLSSMGFDSEIQKALVVTAIGAGAAVVSHANDSGFWVMTQFSGLDVKTGYRVYTTGTFVVGTFAAICVFIVSLFV
ncbi:MAG: GntP family permease [Cyclobacteriaceae bacterium]